MKYKVGDIVCIKSMFEIGIIIDSKGKVGNLPFKVAMNNYCCSRLTIEEVDDVNKTYKMKEDPWHLYNDDMIERKVYNRNESYIQQVEKESEELIKMQCDGEYPFETTDEFEAMYDESERIYNEEYSTGEFCHEQSFKWGFQEGFDFAKKVMIEKSYMWMRQHFMEFVKIENLGSCAHEITIYGEKLWDRYSKAMEE